VAAAVDPTSPEEEPAKHPFTDLEVRREQQMEQRDSLQKCGPAPSERGERGHQKRVLRGVWTDYHS